MSRSPIAAPPVPGARRRAARALVLTVALFAALPAVDTGRTVHAQTGGDSVVTSDWEVPWGGRPRDPYVSPDGERIWFVGQAGNYVAFFTPADQQFTRIEIDEGTHPHTVVTDAQGNAWYAGNRNGMIGRIDATSLEITRFPMPDEAARDPHTIDFDAEGDLWFTLQGSAMVGHLDHRTGEVELVKVPGERPRPYGIIVAPDGIVWFDQFGTNALGRIDPKTMELATYRVPHERARPRRIARTADGMLWYTDYSRGKLGRFDPATEQFSEFDLPGGAGSLPYGMIADDQGRVWVAETGLRPNRLVGFDVETQTFLPPVEVGNDGPNTIRHMTYDPRTRAIWYGDDQGHLGRAIVPVRRSVM